VQLAIKFFILGIKKDDAPGRQGRNPMHTV